jgi:SAM-dependent methyltransferase
VKVPAEEESRLEYTKEVATRYSRFRRIHPGVLAHLLLTGRIGATTRVLEVGCGTGNYITTLDALVGCPCSGLDPSAEMLAQAERDAGSVRFATGRGEALPYADGAFDLVFSVDVIHHVADRASFYREAFRVLSPDGRVCTVTDSELTIPRRVPLTKYFPETVPHELRRYPSSATLHGLMSEAGFALLPDEDASFDRLITDADAYCAKAFSCLHLISDDEHRHGVERMEADLQFGPIRCASLYSLFWAAKPV